MKLAAIMLMVYGALYGQTPDAKPVFEVASIKPSAPYDPKVGRFVRSNGGPGTDDPGLFVCENCRLAFLISIAYEIPAYRLTVPDWMGIDSFIVSAKVPAGATKTQFHLMMQNLLAERFKLAIHRETKDMQMYDLIVAKGGLKLKPSPELQPKKDAAEPDAKKPESTESPKIGKDGFPTLPEGYGQAMMNDRARVLLLRKTTEGFAGFLSSQVGHPVADATGLSGLYDFALFWAYGDGNPRRGAASGDGTPLAGTADPEGPTLFEALQSQLGLKLESKKGPVEIIVVDHMEKAPTEN